MIKRIATGVSVGVVGLVVVLAFLILAGFPLYNRPLEDHNRRIVSDGIALCKASGCKECGQFQYFKPVLDSGPEVRYSASICEMRFQHQEAERLAREEDREIRKKYGTP